MSTAEREALLPCPFCGHLPADLYFAEGSTYRWLTWSCPGCGVGGEERQGSYGNQDRQEPAKAAAREFWNRRAALATSTDKGADPAPSVLSDRAQAGAVQRPVGDE